MAALKNPIWRAWGIVSTKHKTSASWSTGLENRTRIERDRLFPAETAIHLKD